jgi:hypothetical protein
MLKVSRKNLFTYRGELPPLDVQCAIARRLDEATSSASTLTVEARTLQQAANQLGWSVISSAFGGVAPS